MFFFYILKKRQKQKQKAYFLTIWNVILYLFANYLLCLLREKKIYVYGLFSLKVKKIVLQ